MTRILAIAEHVISDAKNAEDGDDFIELGITMVGQGQVNIRTEYPLNTLGNKTQVDALLDRVRAHQEA